jgi:hypothetical protein
MGEASRPHFGDEHERQDEHENSNDRPQSNNWRDDCKHREAVARPLERVVLHQQIRARADLHCCQNDRDVYRRRRDGGQLLCEGVGVPLGTR